VKILVTDADGQLGRALDRLLSARGIPSIMLSDAQLDLSDANAVAAALEHHQPDYVVNARMFGDLEPQEPEPSGWDLAYEQGVRVLADACQRAGAALMHLSSERVFDGSKATAYTENDTLQPVTPIGRSQQRAETAVREHCEHSLILRSSWIFGPDGHNFLTYIIDQAQTSDVIRIVDTQRGCPTAAVDLARVVLAMLEQVDCDVEPALWGIYHYAGSDVTHWHIFAEAIVKAAKKYLEGEVDTVEAVYLSAEDQSRRPQNLELSTRKILATFGIKQMPWRRGVQDALKECFEGPDMQGRDILS